MTALLPLSLAKWSAVRPFLRLFCSTSADASNSMSTCAAHGKQAQPQFEPS